MRSTTDEDGNSVSTWHPVPDTVTRLYNLATEDVLFEQLQAYGGKGWSLFTSVFTLICIILYFVTSSDSASFVVDMMAANGRPEPPLAQKIFWGVTEGMTASVLMLVAGDDDPQAALKAVQAIPIVLGLPYTFHLFYCCQSLIIVCKEEAGELAMQRKNFSNFLIFNVEPMSFVSFLAPFIPAGNVAAEIMGGSKIVYMAGFGFLWVFFIVLCFLTLTDVAFSSMALSAYFMFGTSLGFLRVATRTKLGITGDMVTDLVACNFWMPFALGQMAGEDLTAIPPPVEAIKGDKIGSAEAKQVDI
jgi:choline-glycine betaine transporter